MEESNYLSTLSIDELYGHLLVYEQRMKGYQVEEHVLKVSHDDRSNRGRGRVVFRGGHGRGRGIQPTNKAVIECFKCHKLGHFQYECHDSEKKANYDELEEEELLLMSYADIHQEKKEEIWFQDSGCNNHMTRNKEWFSELEENFNRTVKFGNDTRMVVVAKGSINVQINGIIQGKFVEEIKQDILEWGDEEDIVVDRNEELGETSTNNLSNSPGNFNNSSISNSMSNKSNSLTVSPLNEPGSYDNESVEGRSMRGTREPI
ncbi:uncharacterized protein LOC127104832 [Lathyrus oleraceus]|nr:uncharacterized protein LOC127104832 [Pisum sativum]